MTQPKHLLDEADIGSGEQEDADRKALDQLLGIKPKVKPDTPSPGKDGQPQKQKMDRENNAGERERDENSGA